MLEPGETWLCMPCDCQMTDNIVREMHYNHTTQHAIRREQFLSTFPQVEYVERGGEW